MRTLFLFYFIFIRYFLYISNGIPFPGFPSDKPLSYTHSPCSPTHSLPLPCLGISLHAGIKTSQDQGSLFPLLSNKAGDLLHMQLEPWVPPCVLFGWWFSPWVLWAYWLVHMFVPPMGLQTSSALSVPSLAPPLGTLYSVQWLVESIQLCICQALAEPLSRQLYQAPFSKHLLASTIVSGFGDCRWDESPCGVVCGWSFLWSLLHTLSLYLLP